MSGVDFDTTETAKLGDTTRDWYFLSPEEMKKVMSGEMQMKSYTDDVTKFNPAARLVNDWRKALDSGQNHKWSSTVKASGKGAAVNDYEGSRGLQRIMYENTLGSGGVTMTQTTGVHPKHCGQTRGHSRCTPLAVHLRHGTEGPH